MDYLAQHACIQPLDAELAIEMFDLAYAQLVCVCLCVCVCVSVCVCVYIVCLCTQKSLIKEKKG